MNLDSLPEFIVKLIGSYLNTVECERIKVRCEYLIERKICILEEVIKIIEYKKYKKRYISRVAEVFFGKHNKLVRNPDYEAKGVEYISHTRDEFVNGILGNIRSEIEMLKDTLKYNLRKYYPNTQIEDKKSNLVYRVYSVGQGYLLQSVCKCIRDKK